MSEVIEGLPKGLMTNLGETDSGSQADSVNA